MRDFLKSGLLWQVTGGFVIGSVGLFALQPADARPTVSGIEHVLSSRR